MGYNATYGFRKCDSMDETPLQTKHGETLNFLSVDELGVLRVSQAYDTCAECGVILTGGIEVFVHGVKRYCKKCELKRRMRNRHKTK